MLRWIAVQRGGTNTACCTFGRMSNGGFKFLFFPCVRALASVLGCDETHRTRLPSKAWSALDSGIEHVDVSSDGLVGLGRPQCRC